MSKKKFRDFKSAREFVISLKLKGVKEWEEYKKSGKKPDNIPASPEYIYKNKGWISYGDWLGTGNVATQEKQFRDFESSREFVRKLELKSAKEWTEFCRNNQLPSDISSRPDHVYKNKGWTNWGDFLGTRNVASQEKQFRDFESAREYVRSLKFRNQNEWYEFCRNNQLPSDISSRPDHVYKNKGWISYGDWLGTGNISGVLKSKQYLPFKEAREEARKLAKQYNIKNWEDWRNAVKKGLIPKNIPLNPRQSYSKRRKKDGKNN